MIESNQPSLVTGDDGIDKRGTMTGQSVKPYFGYVFGDVFHLGLKTVFESEQRHENISVVPNKTHVESEKDSYLRGGGLMTRFLFGHVMYFEAGVGYYERKTELVQEYINSNGSGEFTGSKETYKARAIGVGYNAAAGVEIPITAGFFFNADYSVYFYQLKAYRNQSKISRDKEPETIREVNFGLSHYI
jgi:hypothetical protein